MIFAITPILLTAGLGVFFFVFQGYDPQTLQEMSIAVVVGLVVGAAYIAAQIVPILKSKTMSIGGFTLESFFSNLPLHLLVVVATLWSSGSITASGFQIVVWAGFFLVVFLDTVGFSPMLVQRLQLTDEYTKRE